MKQPKLMSFGYTKPNTGDGETFVEDRHAREPERDNTKLKESKKEYERNKRKREYQKSWEKEFCGLEYEEIGMTCRFCTKYKDLVGASAFISGTFTFRKTSIKSHGDSPKHLLAVNAAADVVDESFPASEILGWAKRLMLSPVVYLDFTIAFDNIDDAQ